MISISLVLIPKIIGSLFREKLTFDGIQFQTTRINEALKYILLIDKKMG